MAVRGLLVPQDPNDEPASELLKRIAAEKARLVKEKKIKKQKAQPEIVTNELPFSLPNGWCWSRLDNISPMSLVDGDWIETKDQDPSGGVRLIQLADIGVGEFKDKSERFINQETLMRLNCTTLKEGDILIARLPAPIGRACIFPKLQTQSITVVDVAILRPPENFCAKYLVNAINSMTFHSQVESYGKGATRFRIATGNLKSLLVPIPPLLEQHRIVAKVDELMTLCDQLEQQQESSIGAHQTLVKTLLGALTNGSDREGFTAAWARIVEHFDTLFTTEWSIDQLKQTILQLAVMGKLAPQNPTDEPASELLKKIAAEKAKLIKEGKIKKQKSLPPISEGEKPFSIPIDWLYGRFGDICINRDGERKPVSSEERRGMQGGYDYYGASGVIDKVNDYLFEKSLLLIGEDGANLINRSTPIAFLAHGKYWVNNHAHVIDGISLNFLKYISLFINAINLESYVTGTAQPKMNQAKMNSIVVALPPEAEQHRIVAKVDELMTLCNQLKDRIAVIQITQRHLADTVARKTLD